MRREIIKKISVLMAFMIILNIASMSVFAEEDETKYTVGEIGGYLVGNGKLIEKLYGDRNFSRITGCGWAAERGNNLYDSLKGLDTSVIGDENAKNGADRVIQNKNGTKILIQDKYYKSASDTVGAAFDEDGIYKYVNKDGMPMLLEVPADQYDDVVELMRKKIENGQIRNVTDPAEAENLVKKGSLTYNQAKNLTKAGNIDSLKYDATTGVISSVYATGISFAIDYVVNIINGEEVSDALINSAETGVKTGAIVCITHVVSSQLSKTVVLEVYMPASKALAKVIGEDACRALLQRTGVEIIEKDIAKQASKVIARELLSNSVLVVVLSVPDVVEAFRGRISKEQLLAEITVTGAGVAGAAGGAFGGSSLGTAIFPGVGSVVGGFVGGMAGGVVGTFTTEYVIDKFTESDAEEMIEIIQAEFTELASEYVISENEADLIVEEIQSEIDSDFIKDMYSSDNREEYAREFMECMFEEQAAERTIEIPNEIQTREAAKMLLKDVVFIH
ncbi:MAG: hypothetical protein K2M78_13790 [Lachnospiraceae bacterium]|nr:hypothetical protein [Lachnospiraceae bacterium]